MTLYDPKAAFVSESGETIVGRDRIRPVLTELIKKKARFQSRVIKAVAVGDIALLYTDFQGTILDASQQTFSTGRLKY